MARFVTLKSSLLFIIILAICSFLIFLSKFRTTRTLQYYGVIDSYHNSHNDAQIYTPKAERYFGDVKNHKRGSLRDRYDNINTGGSGNPPNPAENFEEEALNSWKQFAPGHGRPEDVDEDSYYDGDKLYPHGHFISASNLQNISCDINHGKYIVNCIKSKQDVYVPFSFLSKYLEVTGRFTPSNEASKNDKVNKFLWIHSEPKIFYPKKKYNPTEIYAFFENYNVEVRDRVKCVSGSSGVPVSTQWDPKGYYYPIQIAQFALSHYSKSFIEDTPKRIILDDREVEIGNWQRTKMSVQSMPYPLTQNPSNAVISFEPVSLEVPGTAELHLSFDNKDKSKYPIISFKMKYDNEDEKFSGSPSIRITLCVSYNAERYFISYGLEDTFIGLKETSIYYGLGNKSLRSWQLVIRDIGVDLQNGLRFASPMKGRKKNRKNKQNNSIKINRSKVSLVSVGVECSNGRLLMDDLTISSNEHIAQFLQAADWFIENQDQHGGWPIPVRRKFMSTFYPVLEPGWYSAMGQGHALSVLARAYFHISNDASLMEQGKDREKYALACEKALQTIFEKTGNSSGVMAKFMNKYTWYEEYPTNPSSFVLNGFMYALLGLYDVWQIEVSSKAAEKAKQLYHKGLESLKTMLPLYDTGSGSLYDLRHFSVPGIAPNLARVDYHSTHINQLLIFDTIDDSSQIFKNTADRWISYTQGERAQHN